MLTQSSDKIIGDSMIRSYNQTVAVKSQSLKPKAYRELNILEKLNHPNIARLLMFHKTAEKEMCFIFEKMYQTLYERLDSVGPFHHEDALWLSLQLFRALEYLAELLIMHRDIKPSNILLNESARQLKICDFGCAKEITELHEKHVAYMCSRFYRAPELIFGLEQYDYSVDVWSAGCVMAEMLLAR